MATLTTTVTESVVLNGSNQGSSNTLSITGINDIYKPFNLLIMHLL